MTGIVALPRKIAAVVSAGGALVKGKHNPVDASGAARAMTLPTGAAEGVTISVEKTDTSTNLVSVTGSIRGVGASTVNLAWQYESITFVADSAGSWWPTAGHKTKASLDAAYAPATALVTAIQSGKLAPVGSLSFSTTGVTGIPNLRPWSVGNDGVVYGRYGGGLIAARTNAGGTALNGTVDFTAKTEHAGVGNIRWATKTEAGYVVISAKPGFTYIWFSTTWAIGGFSLVATIPFIANDPLGIPQPTVGSDGKTVLFCGIWSGVGGTDNPPLYGSYDGGATWASIKTKPTSGTGPANNHWHAALYDPRWDRTWVSGGDGVNSYFGYSDDHGATWHDSATPADSPIYDSLTYQQPTIMVAFQDRIALGPDRGTFPPGIWEMDQITGKTVKRYQVDATVTTADKQYPIYPHAQSGQVAYIAFPASGTMPVGTRDHTDIVATGDGGRSWYNVARVAWAGVTTMSVNGICGPDANGYLYMVGPTGLTRAPALTWQPA